MRLRFSHNRLPVELILVPSVRRLGRRKAAFREGSRTRSEPRSPRGPPTGPDQGCPAPKPADRSGPPSHARLRVTRPRAGPSPAGFEIPGVRPADAGAKPDGPAAHSDASTD